MPGRIKEMLPTLSSPADPACHLQLGRNSGHRRAKVLHLCDPRRYTSVTKGVVLLLQFHVLQGLRTSLARPWIISQGHKDSSCSSR
ncbi:hypothetical protein RRG08_015394 [Elysia crispata]|uniref:Uncharacterized protein n=1 Tax=Elysia crispata TaxID=231223 RepID=A0AAE1E4G5_9GAST|nr:hypothetical protein RRG08_015394 [Elysia crispata]